jgi:carbamoyltransferase
LGCIYGDICNICGFDPIKGEEWKVMGLAPYGKLDQAVFDILNQILEVDNLVLRFGKHHHQALLELWKYKRRDDQQSIDMADFAFTGQ